MDTIFIRALALDTTIGVYGWERRVSQRLLLDLDVGWDHSAAARADTLAGALDYAAVAATVRGTVEGSSFHLLEALAEQVATDILSTFGASWIRVAVTKPGAVAGARAAGVVIERGEHP